MGNISRDTAWAGLRRAWIERHAQARGHITRPEICRTLGLSLAQASADLQQLQQDHPGCLRYNLNAKRYEWAGGDRLVTTVPAWVSVLMPPPAAAPHPES